MGETTHLVSIAETKAKAHLNLGKTTNQNNKRCSGAQRDSGVVVNLISMLTSSHHSKRRCCLSSVADVELIFTSSKHHLQVQNKCGPPNMRPMKSG